ncbi:MAG: N-acetyl-gamma-glutamyl-phosphate reductase [Desulfobacteraceae bacterium]|nr:N-acetyl-gamma-glutamyl-phosphate reductase [Desulfobacteraceae bacterium]MCF8094147.1 N-acetyl-gamma-glutamyl-phosphate reductase [Desulfobacteraceae bacterium]
MIRVAVAGATGYAGAELVRILAGHPEAVLTVLTSRQYSGLPFDRIYPAMAGVITRQCETFDVESVCDRADVIFTALPHKFPMEIIPGILERGCRVVDLSADFRFSDPAVYEAAYQPHTAKELLSTAVYGLSEVFADETAGAKLVGNPGCYPTSVLLPLIPLIRSDMIDPATIIADSKSGVSGAGRSPSLNTLFCEANESFKAYKVVAHRHQPEMEQILGRIAGKDINISFVPHLVPMNRGMQTTVYASLAEGVGGEAIRDCLHEYYQGRRFIRITEDGRPPDTRDVKGTNYCDIGFVVDSGNRRLILMSVIDNLVKGAAGQAVQNMNIMFGLAETAGLTSAPYPV